MIWPQLDRHCDAVDPVVAARPVPDMQGCPEREGNLPVEPRPWLFRVARNVMLNTHQSAQRQQTVGVRIAACSPAPAPGVWVAAVVQTGRASQTPIHVHLYRIHM